jgi:multicomponent Na+:H+ antiporter subunit B
MSRRVRLTVFAVAATGLAAVLVIGFAGLPDFGDFHGVDGNVINGVGVTERHATDLVTALNFDFRGFDTLGEEFILFGSVLGIVLILRDLRDEQEGPSLDEAEEHHAFGGASEALRTLVLILVPVMLALGGIVLATAPLALFLAGRYLRTRFVSPHTLLEVGEAVGAAGYAMVGVAGLVFVGIFFKNFLPLGISGHLLSAGQIDVASTAVGVEVSGAFLVAWSEFLDQAMMVRRRAR